MDERLKRLIARREQAAEARRQLHASRTALVDNATAEAREDLSTEEDEEFRKITADLVDWDKELTGFDERITELTAEMERDRALTTGAAAVRRARATVSSVTESQTYVKGNGRSYFADLSRVHAGIDGGGDSIARLQRHATDVATSPEYRAGNDRVDGTGGFHLVAAA